MYLAVRYLVFGILESKKVLTVLERGGKGFSFSDERKNPTFRSEGIWYFRG